ncbi:MAG: HEXXH motif-containing putative peptide modification protein [Polyangiaceae bacterium]|nr:HEXXH motif-containing putative peptide modification protein [Polyangiaceae bacterium]
MDPPRDLTIPDPGSATARTILSRAMGVLISDLAALPRMSAAAGFGGEFAAFQRALGRALKASPGAVLSALRSPAIGALVRCLRPGRAEESISQAALLAEVTGLIALELSRASALFEPLRLSRLPRRLLSIHGRFELPLAENHIQCIVFENGRLLLERGPAAGGPVPIDFDEMGRGGDELPIQLNWPYHAVEGDMVLALADNNPLAMAEAHPDKSGNAVDLGGRSPEAWVTALRGALGLIEQCLPDLRREIDLYIHQFVPVGWFEERHLSASYQEAVGTIYISLHPSPMTMVEAVIHEFSHNKLNALFELDAVLENAWSPLYTSPVRPDPRPLHGVLLAVHAFLPVARLYEQMIEKGDPRSKNTAFLKRFEQIRQVNREGAATLLQNARPTAVGMGLIDEIRRWDEYYAGFGTI